MNDTDRFDEFVFIGADGQPYFCCQWGNDPWLFKWHPDKKWVSCRKLTAGDVSNLPRNLAPERQQLYLDLARGNTWKVEDNE